MSSLVVSLSDSLTPPSANHKLLMGFYFGENPLSYDHPGVIDSRLSPVDRNELFECWWVEGDVEYSEQGDLKFAQSDDYAVAVFADDERESNTIAELTYEAYRQLLNSSQSAEYPWFLKIWNCLGNINEGDGDDERYRQFSTGRAKAFDEAGLQDSDVPTGTGVGSIQARGLTIVALSSKNPAKLTENPRQISAFNYPRLYGPRSPKFARGASIDTQDFRLCLISGTASIVGHESLHAEDAKAQLAEILQNLETLHRELSAGSPDRAPVTLGKHSVLRVYLRNSEDYEYVAERLRGIAGIDDHKLVFLRADICRAELILEIDGVHLQA